MSTKLLAINGGCFLEVVEGYCVYICSVEEFSAMSPARRGDEIRRITDRFYFFLERQLRLIGLERPKPN